MSEDIEAIVMPKLGLSMTEGMVAQWYVDAGSRVSPGDVIADIETSKITNELEVHTAGMIRGPLAETGIELPVGALIGVIASESVSDEEIEKFVSGFVPESEDSIEVLGESELDNQASQTSTPMIEPESRSVNISIPDSLKDDIDDSSVIATHLARKLAKKTGINLKKVSGTGRRGRVSIKDIKSAVHAAGGNLSSSSKFAASITSEIDDDKIPATPLARRIAKDVGIQLAMIKPTGSRGRITKSDVENAIGSSTSTVQQTQQENVLTGIFEEQTLSSMRRMIAERLTESKQSAPHFRLTIEVNIDQMLKLRADLNQEADNGKVSINDLLIKALATALIKVPEVNIQFDGKVIRKFQNADIAVAVALEQGLITPIVRSANKKNVNEISAEMVELGKRAKSGSLMPEEFEGGTFTLSNLGMFGIKSFDAIINPPQAAILAVGAGEKRRVFSGEDEVVATMLALTLSCDHRVIDGAIGARFLQMLKMVIEHPYKMLM